MNEQANLQETVDSFLRTQIAAKVEVDVSEIPPGTKPSVGHRRSRHGWRALLGGPPVATPPSRHSPLAS